jgi:choice-of-anchor A domain-containing protein
MKFVSLAAAVAMLGLTTQAAHAAPIDTLEAVLSTYNAMIFGNMGSAANPYGSDSEGAVAVGGNAYLRDFTVASVSNHGANALTVGGNLNQLRAEDHGNVFVGGNADFHDGMQGGATVFGTITVDGTLVHAPTQYVGTRLTGPSPIDFNAVRTDILAASQQLATTTAGTLGTSGHFNPYNPGNFDLIGNSTGLNVFNIDGSMLNALSSGQFEIDVPTGATVLINVSGTTFNFGNFGFFCDSDSNYCSNSKTDAAKILFNFYQATSITMTQIGMLGSVLAPLADVTFYNGNINGTLIANSLAGGPSYMYGEFHDVSFTGTLGVPAPGALSLMLLGFVGLAFRRRAI